MSYDAFISYSHNTDNTLAAALQSALHRFAKPWYKLRALHIFRDQTNLAVNPALWSSIRDALDQSSFFILLASPEAAASPWVAKEAEYWIARNGQSHILIVLTSGILKWDPSAASYTPEHTNALPASLLRSFPEEPLFLDLRWGHDSAARLRLREPRFHEAVLQLASTLHNRPKEDLDGADIRMQRQTRLFAASGLIAVLLIALFALRQTRLSREESIKNLAASLAANSAKVLADSPDRAREAALLAIESNRLNPSFEGNQALRAAVSLLPAGAQSYPPEDSDPDQRIRGMAFSPNGGSLAVVRDNGSTQLIDVLKRTPPVYLEPDAQPVSRIVLAPDPKDVSLDNHSAVSVAFDSTGSMLASGGGDGFAHVWALPGASELLRVFHGTGVSQVAFRAKTNQLVTASDDGHVRIFDVSGAVIAGDFECPGKVVSISFSPGGDLLAALSSQGPVCLFDLVHRNLVRKLFDGAAEAAFNVVFSNDGKRLATAAGSFAFVWDVSSGQELLRATHAASSETLHTLQWIYDAAISSDGKFLAYAARGDKLAHVWNVDTGQQILELKHNSAVAAVAFNAEATRLGTGSYDGTARVWELPSGVELERASHGGGAEVVAFSPSGSFAAGGMDGSVSVSETRRADRPASFDLPDQVRSVAFSPDGRRFAIGTRFHSSPMVRIAEVSGQVLRDIGLDGAPSIDKLTFPDPNHVLAQWSQKLFLVQVDKGSVTPLPNIPGEKAIDPSGRVLAIQEDGVNQLYALPRLQPTTFLNGASGYMLRLAGEGRLMIFDAKKPPNEFFIDIWSVPTKSRVSHILLPAELNRIAINPSGTILFTAESENLQGWDIPSGKRRFSLTASDDIDVIIPDPSSASFATLTHGRLTVWDAVNGARLAQLPDTGYIRAAAFSPDGRYLLAGFDEHYAALWLWRSDDLRDQACTRLARNMSREEWVRWFPKQPYRPICPDLPVSN